MRSGLPSPLTSAAVTESRTAAGGEGLLGGEGRRWSRPAASCSAAPTPCVESELATMRSGLPSPLTSAAVTEYGTGARGEGLLGGEGGEWSRPAPSCSAAPTPCCRAELATMRSGLPSPLRSAVVTETGYAAGGEGLLGGEVRRWSRPAPSCSAAPTPCCRAVVGDDEVGLAVAVDVRHRHGDGTLPVAKVCWAAKEGVVEPGGVVFSSTDTVLASWLATMRSGLPSPLRSAAATETGALPVAKVCWAAKPGVTSPPEHRRVQQHRHRVRRRSWRR